MNKNWPELSYDKYKDTYQTIHLWTQIIGKIKMAKMPWINHSWHVTLLVTTSGLSTGNVSSDGKHFQINLNFLKHRLEILTSSDEEKRFDLFSFSVRACYRNILASLNEFGIEVKINPIPSELENPVPLNIDERNTYNSEAASALHLSLLNCNKVFTNFRSGFSGKSSPVHFFWGSFDLAVSRFSGKKAPPHPGGIPNLPDWVAREAYSDEVFSCGFWPGSEVMPEAAFYSYIYPEPEGFNKKSVMPGFSYYHHDLREFILPYKYVYEAANPPDVLLDFLQSTYNAAADMSGWDKQRLELKLKR